VWMPNRPSRTLWGAVAALSFLMASLGAFAQDATPGVGAPARRALKSLSFSCAEDMCEMVLTFPSRKRHVTEAWSIPVEVPTAVTKTCSSRQADLNPLASLHDGQFSPSALTFSSLAAPVHPHAQVQDVSRLPTLAAPDDVP
jgi:hypothetical protein